MVQAGASEDVASTLSGPELGIAHGLHPVVGGKGNFIVPFPLKRNKPNILLARGQVNEARLCCQMLKN